MDKQELKEFNEELDKMINELSPATKKSYLDKRQAQADAAQKSLNKAKSIVKKSNLAQIKNLPDKTSEENAKNALKELKSKMQQVDRGSDWRFDDSSDNVLTLSVRYWGDWENPEDYEDEEDYDWQVLTDKYREKLEDILIDIELKYGVQIIEPGSEKNWLDFDIYIENIPENNFTKEDIEYIKQNILDIGKSLGWKEHRPSYPNADLEGIAIESPKGFILDAAYYPSKPNFRARWQIALLNQELEDIDYFETVKKNSQTNDQIIRQVERMLIENSMQKEKERVAKIFYDLAKSDKDLSSIDIKENIEEHIDTIYPYTAFVFYLDKFDKDKGSIYIEAGYSDNTIFMGVQNDEGVIEDTNIDITKSDADIKKQLKSFFNKIKKLV